MTRQETMTRTQQRQRQRFERAIQFIFERELESVARLPRRSRDRKVLRWARALAQRPKRTWARRQYFVKGVKYEVDGPAA